MNRNVKGHAAVRGPRGLMRSALCCAIAGSLLLTAALPAAAQEYQEPGRVGDPDSWRTDEFLADWGLGAIGAEYAYARGLTGYGIRLGVFDTGSVLEHPELAGRGHNAIVIADPGCSNTSNLWGCFYSDGGVSAIDGYLAPPGYVWSGSGEALDLEYNAHGTHVAGTMVASRNGDGGMHGVAFGASLTASKLFFNTLHEYYFDAFGGLGVASHTIGPSDAAVLGMYEQMAAQGVRAINHSWGLSGEPTTAADMDAFYGYYADYFSVYTRGSIDTGMIQVWAAGNDYGNIAGVYSTLPRWVPEAEPYWLTVVNVNESGSIDASSSICGLAAQWCLAAPGTNIASSVVGGEIDGEVLVNPDGSISLEITGERPEYGYAYYTGTSMATPHVTGALALLMERYPYLDNAQVRDVMLTTATDLGAAGVDEIYGWGLLNLRDAINGPGQIRVDTEVVMNQHAGGAKVWEGEAWDDWSNDIGGSGRLTKSGVGWLRLSGNNSFGGLTVDDGVLELTGANSLGDTVVNGGWALLAEGGSLSNDVTVNGGELIVDGVHSGVLTVAGGVLAGLGTVGSTTVAGTVAPGHSIGTLTVAGDYRQQAGSFFDAELGLDAAADRIAIGGSAELLGGTVRVFGSPGEYLLGQSYTLLTADGGVAGRFGGVDSGAFSPFLAFELDYAANAVGLDVIRGMALAEAAQTRNQLAVATAADSMADTDPLLARLVQLFPAQATGAFDALSGEYHASARGLLLEGSRHVRAAALDRAAPPASPAAAEAGGGAVAWVQGFGAGGEFEDDGNAAALDYNGRGTLIGVDYVFAGDWRLGVLGGLERTDLKLFARGSEGDVKSRHLGLYLGRQWRGGFGLRAGAAYARHEVDSERTVAFPGVDQHLVAEYRAHTTQAFVEGGYRFGGDDWSVQPFVQYAHVEVESDDFREVGGSAALHGEKRDSAVNLATAGLRLDLGLRGAQQTESWLRWRSTLGWRHASGDLVPETRVGWAGAPSFTVAGAPIADGAALVETGLAAWLTPGTLLELNYSGQFAAETRDHGFAARLSVRF